MVTKLIRLIGVSTSSWEEAAENTVAEAAKTVRNIKRIYVDRLIGVVEEGKIKQYRAAITLAFDVERERGTEQQVDMKTQG